MTHPVVQVRQPRHVGPPRRAELREPHPSRPTFVKVVYVDSRAGAWVDRGRVIEENPLPRAKKATAADTTTIAPESADAASSAQLVDVDPAQLVIGANVRLDPVVDRDLVDSIRQRGVLEAIAVYRGDDGALVVLRGQRRTLAAVTAGRSSVPVIVGDRPVEADRVIDQLVENEHRAALGIGERVAAYEQLAALGLSAAQIARRTSRPRVDVDAALAVAASSHARTAVTEHPLTLDQAAVIAEFGADDGVTGELIAAAAVGRFDHVAQRLRDTRDEQQAAAALAAQLADAGVRVVEKPAFGAPAKRLDQFREPPTVEEHSTCPGHAAYVSTDWSWDDDGPDDQAQTVVADAVYVCTDPADNGHTILTRFVTGAKPPGADDKTDAQREAERAARADVIESNKAWASAETVRRRWLRGFVARKSAPKGSALFVASALGWADHALREALLEGNPLAHELLGLTRPLGYDKRGAAVDIALGEATEPRAQMLALAVILAAYEHGTDREHWRTPNSGTARYLRYLEGQGYELSDVELRAAGEATETKAKPAAKRR